MQRIQYVPHEQDRSADANMAASRSQVLLNDSVPRRFRKPCRLFSKSAIAGIVRIPILVFREQSRETQADVIDASAGQSEIALVSQTLPYRLEMDHGKAVVTLMPELNNVPWSDIEKVGTEILDRLRGSSHPNVLVDLCRLDYMGSAQVALVVRIWKAVKEQDGRMVVSNQNDMVFQVLQLAGLDKVWQIVGSREAGLHKLGWTGGSDGGSETAAGADASFPLFAGVSGIVIALIGVALHFLSGGKMPVGIPIGLELVGALVAFFASFWGVLNARGQQRNLLSMVCMVSLILLLAGVFWAAKTDWNPSPRNLVPSPEANPNPVKSADSPQKPPVEETPDKESGK